MKKCLPILFVAFALVAVFYYWKKQKEKQQIEIEAERVEAELLQLEKQNRKENKNIFTLNIESTKQVMFKVSAFDGPLKYELIRGPLRTERGIKKVEFILKVNQRTKTLHASLLQARDSFKSTYSRPFGFKDIPEFLRESKIFTSKTMDFDPSEKEYLIIDSIESKQKIILEIE